MFEVLDHASRLGSALQTKGVATEKDVTLTTYLDLYVQGHYCDARCKRTLRDRWRGVGQYFVCTVLHGTKNTHLASWL